MGKIIKRRGIKEVSFRAPNDSYGEYGEPIKKEPMLESERLRLYEISMKIQQIQIDLADSKSPLAAREARAKKAELDELIAGFVFDLAEHGELGSYDGRAYGTYTWPDKNLSVAISHVPIKRKHIKDMILEWRVDFISH